MANKDQLLQEIVRLSHRIHDHARVGEWDSAGTLEQERRGLIEDCFAQNPAFADTDVAAGRIRHLIDLDREVVALADRKRHEIGDELCRLQQGRSATKAYHQNT